MTLPSHTSILTGLDPSHHGVRTNLEYRLGGSPETLATLFRKGGMETAAFVSSFVLDARFGLSRDFDLYDDRVHTEEGAFFSTGVNERPAGEVTDAALDWLCSRGPRPFFAWVHYFDAHTPYAAPRRFAAAHRDPYDAEIAYVDEQIGRLLDALDENGAAARTVVVVVADHGESLGEHGELTHGIFLYDSTTRVPLIFRAPGLLPAGRTVTDAIASTVDILPTLVDLFGLPDREPRDGRSWVASPPDGRRLAHLESRVPLESFGWAPLFAVRSADAKVVLAPKSEYYDLESDPGETRNLFPEPDDRGRDRIRRLGREARELATRVSTNASAPIPAEARARLESLGYLSGVPVDGSAALADPKDRIEVSDAMIRSIALFAAGDYAGSLAVVEPLVRLYPADPSLLRMAGKCHLRLGRIAEAERDFRAFLALGDNADVDLFLAQILVARGELREATGLLDRAELLDPFHGGVWIARGDIAVVEKRWSDAIEAYETAVTLDPYRAAGAAEKRIENLRRALAKAGITLDE